MATAAASAAIPLTSKLASVGSFLSGTGSALGGLGAIGSLFKSGKKGGIDVGATMALMKYQTDLEKEMTQWTNENQWKFMRTGLENANYNPLLALGASPSSGSMPNAIANSGEEKTVDPSAVLQSLATIAQIENLRANTANTKAGALGKLLGSDNINKIKTFFGRDSDEVSKDLKSLVKQSLTGIKKGLVSTAQGIFENGVETGQALKGYITNDNSPFREVSEDYVKRVGQNRYKVRYNRPPSTLPY